MVYYLYPLFFALQVLGVLSSLQVTLLWAIEQINILVFGQTARCSDLRIIASFILNVGAVVLFYFMIESE